MPLSVENSAKMRADIGTQITTGYGGTRFNKTAWQRVFKAPLGKNYAIPEWHFLSSIM
ncbi:MAG: hypothetical protein IAF58_03975 [Leptolyngbya sp.]|nr:hypothetical protein [Candidatus Melainabacteria bacterium]